MHLLLADDGCEPFLLEELRRAFPGEQPELLSPGMVASEFPLQAEAPPRLVFARQFLPEAALHRIASISAWAEVLVTLVTQSFPEDQPWQLHIVPHYGSPQAGLNRCRLIRTAVSELLRRKRRVLLRSLDPAPRSFTESHSIVQLLLTSPDAGYIAAAVAPTPFALRHILWPFPNGEIPVAVDKSAPSRAFAKLLEAEERMGCRIMAGETCLDLGAAPGSWSYVALHRGARVLAVDRAPLRGDLMADTCLIHHQADAFAFVPSQPVDWLLCDVIATPQRSAELLLRWLRQKQMKRFIVTLKFKGTSEYGLLEQLKHAIPPLCADFYLTRLCANKNEVCAFGTTSRSSRL